jgi:Immunity protein 15
MILTQNQSQDLKLQRILKTGKLSDTSQFYSPAFCDEVPLYSRDKQISFLKELSLEQKNITLLEWGLRYLKSIIKGYSGSEPFFAALTLWQNEGDDVIVPRIFVCNNNPKREIKKLMLHKGKSAFSKKINHFLSQIPENGHVLLEDDQTLEDEVRVFVGPKAPPFPQFVTLHSVEQNGKGKTPA